MLNRDKLLFLISILPSLADRYRIAVMLAQDFSNSLAYSMISGKLERMNLLCPLPE